MRNIEYRFLRLLVILRRKQQVGKLRLLAEADVLMSLSCLNEAD